VDSALAVAVFSGNVAAACAITHLSDTAAEHTSVAPAHTCLQWPNATPFGIDHIGGKDYLKLGSRYWMMVSGCPSVSSTVVLLAARYSL
jgi:hypothetical protein